MDPSGFIIKENLEKARRNLLDLSLRNRLLNFRRTRRTVAVIDELPDQVYRILVEDEREMVFLPLKDSDQKTEAEAGLSDEAKRMLGEDIEDLGRLIPPPPDEDGGKGGEGGIEAKYTDNRLQTHHDRAELHRRLLTLYRDSRRAIEETGRNILFLSIGFLEWTESPESDRSLLAPLILIPARLDRDSVNAGFRLSFTGEDLSTNLSLAERLQRDFGIGLPKMEEDDLTPESYIAEVGKAVAEQSRWRVRREMILGFFSFGKLLMYRDLDPDTWSEDDLTAHPVFRAILGGADPPGELPFGEDLMIDEAVDLRDTNLVLDADSSQHTAILDALSGNNLVIEGPPGTGKSQTIANTIAELLARGKKVLFVCEKMAALEVVHRRLSACGLGDFVLELHSHKTSKAKLLGELESRLKTRCDPASRVEDTVDGLRKARDRLNRYAKVINSPFGAGEYTVHQLVGFRELLTLNSGPLPRIHLEAPERISRSVLDSRTAALKALAEAGRTAGDPSRSPWAGIELRRFLPGDEEKTAGVLNRLLDAASLASDLLEEASGKLRLDIPLTPLGLDRLVALRDLAGRIPERVCPGLPPLALSDPSAATEVVESGKARARRLLEREAGLAARIDVSALPGDLDAAIDIFRAKAGSLFRIFSGAYRLWARRYKGWARGARKGGAADWAEVLEGVVACRNERRAFAGEKTLSEHLGPHFKGADTDWGAVDETLAWAETVKNSGLPERLIAHLLGRGFEPRVREAAAVENPKEVRDAFRKAWSDLAAGCAEIDETLFLGAPLPEAELSRIVSRAFSCGDSTDAMRVWSNFCTALRLCREEGLDDVIAEVLKGSLPLEKAEDAYRWSYADEMCRRAVETEPVLANFDGATHDRLREKFRDLDRRLIEQTRSKIAGRLCAAQPPAGRSGGRVSELTEMALLNREIQKKRRHIPIRRLLARAGRAIQALKPCFMMSPLSVAQYLTPGAVTYDVVLMDEASQILPHDALGAIVRANQVIVVGDPKQLPPTTFFSTLAGETEDPGMTEEMESILDVCGSAFRPMRRLRWHYRSRHESLIALSNRAFYDNDLLVFPSPDRETDDLGVKFVFVADGVYDRGGSRTNAAEARRVAEAVIEHARDRPHKSLGVGTFNQAQQVRIEDELELVRRDNPDLEPFFSDDKEEPFFVKNLENIQGDERDVIFIGVTYGPDRERKVAMSFGPINQEGGWRRLNVIITRAREKMVVFSSMRADDIDPARARARGVADLKRFLAYAETGRLDLPETRTGREMDSPLEEAVAEVLRRRGHEVIPQVGVAGFYIDLAVRNPDRSGELILGVECDGATYHSSRSARDRDRLRQEVLEGLGWRIHRIWSTDWFLDRENQVRRLLDAVDRARGGKPGEDRSESRPAPPPPPPGREAPEGPGRDLGRDDARALLFRLREKIRREVQHAPEEGVLRKDLLQRIIETLPETVEAFKEAIPAGLLEATDERTFKYIPEILAILRRMKR